MPEFFMNVVFSLQSDSVNKGSQARQVMKLILCNFYQKYDQLHFNFSRKLYITFVKAALENQEPSSCSQTGILFCFLFSQPQRQTTADHDRHSKRKPITTVQLYCHQSVEKLELLSMATPSAVMRRRLKQVLFNLVKSKIIETQNYCKIYEKVRLFLAKVVFARCLQLSSFSLGQRTLLGSKCL